MKYKSWFFNKKFRDHGRNWYLLLNFLPWSRNFLCKNHDLYFKTQNLYYWKEISQILYPRTQNLYYRFCSTEIKLGYKFWDLQILRAFDLLFLSFESPNQWSLDLQQLKRGSTFTLCHALLKKAILDHTKAAISS